MGAAWRAISGDQSELGRAQSGGPRPADHGDLPARDPALPGERPNFIVLPGDWHGVCACGGSASWRLRRIDQFDLPLN